MPNPEIFIYDTIGPAWAGMVDAKGIVDSLAKYSSERVTVRINSDGGSADEGFAIHNAIARHPGGVDIVIDGLAASSASLIAMAGRTIKIAANAAIMIHEPYTMAFGNAEDMRKVAEVLDNYRDRIVTTYEGRVGKKSTKDQISQWVADETWMTAQQALDRGFVDSIGEESMKAKNIKVPQNRYRNTPQNLLATPEEEIKAANKRWLVRENMRLALRQKSA